MSIDLTKLRPAPWTVTTDGEWNFVCHPNGMAMLLPESDDDPFDVEALRFAALARNALDVMLRRGWGVGEVRGEGPMKGWYVVLPAGWFPLDSNLYPLANMRHLDPFTALVEADAWYVANVESKRA